MCKRKTKQKQEKKVMTMIINPLTCRCNESQASVTSLLLEFVLVSKPYWCSIVSVMCLTISFVSCREKKKIPLPMAF